MESNFIACEIGRQLAMLANLVNDCFEENVPRIADLKQSFDLNGLDTKRYFKLMIECLFQM